MAASRAWMFCPMTGALLTVDPQTGVASCAESKYSIDLTSAFDVLLLAKKHSLGRYREKQWRLMLQIFQPQR